MAQCELCGEPMPAGEEMFKYHGYSGPCPNGALTRWPVSAPVAQAPDVATTFDLISHLERQREFSARTFGPGRRTAGVVDHIRRELLEVEAAPDDLTEWVDVVLLALDGAWRAGHSSEAIARAIAAKQAKNELRTWPDWRTADRDKAITHVRSGGE